MTKPLLLLCLLRLLLLAGATPVADPALLPRQSRRVASDVRTPVLAPQSPVRRDALATEDAPRGFNPAKVACPAQGLAIRRGAALSGDEQRWLARRRAETTGHTRALLRRLAIPGFDSDGFLDRAGDGGAPKIGIAVSGGGYRAMLNGAGALAAWDIRSDGSTARGNLGGLLQSATYLSGLSGGGWLVGSLFTNNFTSVQDSLRSPNLWHFEEGAFRQIVLRYLSPLISTAASHLIGSVSGASSRPFTLTEVWAKILSRQLINTTKSDNGFTFSSIANDKGFSGAQTPWPFILADGRPHEQRTIRLDGTVFEFSPFELGSFDRTLNGFVPLRYAGSTFNNGQLDRSSCVRGYDNAGYVMATASTLFIGAYNVLEMQLDPSSFRVLGIFQLITNIAEGVLSTADRFDILDSVWEPNPFRGWEPSTNPVADEKNLHLVDAGLDRQNIPFHPHIFRDRRVDVVFSVDSSADTSFNWPDGSSAVATYRRSLMNTGDRTSFPVIPGQDTFLNEGLNTRPVFFGCDVANTTSPSPLIVYLPNYPYVYQSNLSTFTFQMDTQKRDSVVRNGWAVVTQLNSTRDRDWPSCVGCAILLRSFQRTGAPVPARCSKCFNNYCWNGRIDESKPAPYEPQVLNSTALDSWTI